MRKDLHHETVAMQNSPESLIADAKEAQPELEYPFRENTCSSKPAIDTKGTKPAVLLQSPGIGMVFLSVASALSREDASGTLLNGIKMSGFWTRLYKLKGKSVKCFLGLLKIL